MATILDEFITQKLNDYVEPSRKGIRRGNPIGFSKIKYSAALFFSLTKLNLLKVTDHVHGSYNVIRVWRSQDDFKRCCHDIAEEFKGIVDFELMVIATHLADDFKHGKFHGHDELFEKLKDACTYNKNIINHIIDRLNHYLYERPNGYIAFNDMAFYLAKIAGEPKLLELLARQEVKLRKNLIEEAISTLQQPELSIEEKGGVVSNLQRLLA